MTKTLSLNNRFVNLYVNDIKAFLLGRKSFNYTLYDSTPNTQHSNIVFYNKTVTKKILKKIGQNVKSHTHNNSQHYLDIPIVESLIFNLDPLIDIKFNIKNNTNIINNRTAIKNSNKIDLSFDKNNYFVYFVIKENFRNAILHKINDNVGVFKTTLQHKFNKNKLSNTELNNPFINQIIDKGPKLLMIENDYFSFEPVFDLNLILSNFKKYFNSFQCSYFYYVDSTSMEIILNYYIKLNELLTLAEKHSDINKLNDRLSILNDNTLILLKRNKLL